MNGFLMGPNYNNENEGPKNPSKKKRKLIRKRTKANKSAASESDAADKENHSVNKTIRADLLEAILGSPPPNYKINDKLKENGTAALASVAVDNGNRIEDCVKKEETEEMADETTAPASVDNENRIEVCVKKEEAN